MIMMAMMILMYFLHSKGSQTKLAPEWWGGEGINKNDYDDNDDGDDDDNN